MALPCGKACLLSSASGGSTAFVTQRKSVGDNPRKDLPCDIILDVELLAIRDQVGSLSLPIFSMDVENPCLFFSLGESVIV